MHVRIIAAGPLRSGSGEGGMGARGNGAACDCGWARLGYRPKAFFGHEMAVRGRFHRGPVHVMTGRPKFVALIVHAAATHRPCAHYVKGLQVRAARIQGPKFLTWT